MKIGILGAGSIGRTLTRRLSSAGHDVTVANSRGPETIDTEILLSGARAVSAHEVVGGGVETLILSVPFGQLPQLASLVRRTSSNAVIIDTSNYYPQRDGHIEEVDGGQTESEWVVRQLGRPIVKAWNAIGAVSFATNQTERGTPGRIAIPVAADRASDRAIAMKLVDDTGFDAFDGGRLTHSWRQQPGTPAYCTDLTSDQMAHALASAEASRSPKRRDLAWAALEERFGPGDNSDPGYLLRLNRLLFM